MPFPCSGVAQIMVAATGHLTDSHLFMVGKVVETKTASGSVQFYGGVDVRFCQKGLQRYNPIGLWLLLWICGLSESLDLALPFTKVCVMVICALESGSVVFMPIVTLLKGG